MTTPQRQLKPPKKISGPTKLFLVIFASVNLFCAGVCGIGQIKHRLEKPERDAERAARAREPACPMRDLSGEKVSAWYDACANEKAYTCTMNGGGGFIDGPSCIECVDSSIGMYSSHLTVRKAVRACVK